MPECRARTMYGVDAPHRDRARREPLADPPLHRHTCKVFKLFVGILKGAIIGGALGYGAFALEDATGFISPWLTYGVIGALVGLVVGRPIWSLLRDKNATAWVSILKAAFGFGVGCGLFAIASWLWRLWHPSLMIEVAGKPQNVFDWQVTLGAAIGAVYGGFVELDDAIGEKPAPAQSARGQAQPPAKKQPQPPAKR